MNDTIKSHQPEFICPQCASEETTIVEQEIQQDPDEMGDGVISWIKHDVQCENVKCSVPFIVFTDLVYSGSEQKRTPV